MDSGGAAQFVLQVAVIIIAANLMGRLFSRVLKQPSVLGELVAGMIIGPFALGGLAVGAFGPLFARPEGAGLGVGDELHALALLASAVLLFFAGLETDVQKFLRYSVAGLVTGLGGAALSFALGDAVVVWTGHAAGYLAPEALFMGTVATATSVGLTARVLSEKRKMDTAEGATILSGAVIDDVIGLICLATVLGLVAHGAQSGKGHIDWGHVAWLVGKALLFWVGTLAAGILLARQIGGFLKLFGPRRVVAVAALALAFLLAALAEKAGLALIIGAYTMGLSLSRLDAVHEIQNRLTPIHALLVPIFFCVTGMMVDVGTFLHFLPLGLAFAGVAVVGKVVGCGAPAYLIGFNTRGALRIGLGMMPRQEVALIVAGVGLAAGVLSPGLFGAVVVLTLITALAAPVLLGWVFDNRSGLRRPDRVPPRASEEFRLHLPAPEVADLVAALKAGAFRQEEFFTHYRSELDSYEFRKDALTVFMQRDEATLVFSTSPHGLEYARIVVSEEMVELRDLFSRAAAVNDDSDLRRLLLGEPT